MKQIIYAHSKAIIKECQKPKMNDGYLIHHYFVVVPNTQSISRYYEIIRMLSPVYRVIVVRDPHNVAMGLYVAGYHSLVVKFISTLKDIINKVEKVTSRVKKNAYNKKLHLSEARANFRMKCINIYINNFNKSLKPLPFKKTIIKEYISQAIRNRNFKPFKWHSY